MIGERSYWPGRALASSSRVTFLGRLVEGVPTGRVLQKQAGEMGSLASASHRKSSKFVSHNRLLSVLADSRKNLIS